MPFLRFKGFPKETLHRLSPQLIDRFANVAEVPKERVKIELLQIEKITDTPLSLEIYMFQREQQRHDAIAATMDQLLKLHGFSHVHIFFLILTPSLYYKDGSPLTHYPLQAEETVLP